MSTKFYVTKETVCSRCKGIGIIQTPLWVDYWEAVEKGEIKRDHQIMLDWFEDFGFSKWDDGPLPPEEMPCHECDGLGVFVEKVELADALRELRMAKEGEENLWLFPPEEADRALARSCLY